MQILLFPVLQLVVMEISLFHLAEPFGMGHFAAIMRFHSQVVMKHLMIYDAGYDVFRYITPVQHRINADNFGAVRITGEFNRILLPHSPPGTPGYLAVYFVCKVFAIHLVEQFLEMEVSSIMT